MEEKDKHIVFSYGRMNPPTAGHSKVVDKVKSHADKIGANHAVVVAGQIVALNHKPDRKTRWTWRVLAAAPVQHCS